MNNTDAKKLDVYEGIIAASIFVNLFLIGVLATDLLIGQFESSDPATLVSILVSVILLLVLCICMVLFNRGIRSLDMQNRLSRINELFISVSAAVWGYVIFSVIGIGMAANTTSDEEVSAHYKAMFAGAGCVLFILLCAKIYTYIRMRKMVKAGLTATKPAVPKSQ